MCATTPTLGFRRPICSLKAKTLALGLAQWIHVLNEVRLHRAGPLRQIMLGFHALVLPVNSELRQVSLKEVSEVQGCCQKLIGRTEEGAARGVPP